jgi:hypothetical protein
MQFSHQVLALTSRQSRMFLKNYSIEAASSELSLGSLLAWGGVIGNKTLKVAPTPA